MSSPSGESRKVPEDDLASQIGRQAERKARARQRPARSAWFGLGMFGLIGWSVAVPTMIGISLGIWIDRRWPSEVSWTLTFLIIGVVIGCTNAWYWIRQESKHD